VAVSVTIRTRLDTAFFDTRGAIRVLTEGAIFPAVATQVGVAQQRIVQAQQTNDAQVRRTRIQRAIAELTGAAAGMVTS
jgi:hypothetical protein